jgi:predicted phage terminase large subunit-like protein
MALTADVIRGFVGSMLQKNFDGAVESPDCHMEWWKYCCDPHQQVALAAPRGHAKSTAITFAYTLANLVFRERSYVLIVSDTVSQAVQFLADLKKELMDNDKIRTLFKIKEFLKDSEDDFIVGCEDGHVFRVQAKGSEQKVRGLKWNNKRPDLIVCDDLENDEIVLNKERREKFRRWFFSALVPCKSAYGIVRYVGTILHADSLLERLMPQRHDKMTVTDELKTYSTRKGTAWLSVKYRAHTDDFTKILWDTRFDKQWFVSKRQEYIDQGIPEAYSQEFLNIPIDESVSYFKRADFLPDTKEDRAKKINYYISVDLAISKEDSADYSVFVVGGLDENRILHIRDVIRERLDGREIVDMILSLNKIYNPECIGIEDMQVTKSIGPFLREEMIFTNNFPTIIQLKHGGKDKISRARSIQARLRAKSVKFSKEEDWYPAFEDEMCMFPRGKHDDQVDAFAYLGLLLDKMVEAPTKQEEEEDEYRSELRESEHGDAGRSTFTGY